jgi:hypothetical protein
VLANDLLAGDVSPTVSLVQDVEQGTLTLHENGGFHYLSPSGFEGMVEFQYRVSESDQLSPVAKVTLHVLGGSAVPGDFDNNQAVDLQDVNLLCAAIQDDETDEYFDLNADGLVNDVDWDVMLGVILKTTAGDVNLDRRFDSADLVTVFVANQYEDALADNSNWATGDWDCDGDFSSGDLVAAFMAGNYVTDASFVPSESAFKMSADVAAGVFDDGQQLGRLRRRPVADSTQYPLKMRRG